MPKRARRKPGNARPVTAWTACRNCRKRPTLPDKTPSILCRTLNDYKSGARKNEMMSVIIGQLTPEDINDLAAYYASIQITVTPPK